MGDEVDILFGNEDELLSLYEVDSFDAAIAPVRRDCAAGGDHVGKEGCVVVTTDEVVEVPAEPVDRVLDTTGAGDLFAAGFLYGSRRGALAECATARRDRRRRGDLATSVPVRSSS